MTSEEWAREELLLYRKLVRRPVINCLLIRLVGLQAIYLLPLCLHANSTHLDLNTRACGHIIRAQLAPPPPNTGANRNAPLMVACMLSLR